MPKVALTSLGCARNLVDSEVIIGSLKRDGFDITDADDGADICVINTCAFIRPAREESVEAILAASRLKKEGRIKKIVVAGCLAQLYRAKLAKALPEIDLVVGTGDIPAVSRLVRGLLKAKGPMAVSRRPSYLYDDRTTRVRLTPPHYAYVKVSEGCSNLCSYCIISRLRGSFRSRSIESVVREVKKLSDDGRLKEIDLIGQDTTLFGIDRHGKERFAELLKKICAVKNKVKWVRILYTHPAHYTDELISVVRGEEKLCKYLDLPVQHISDKILKRMNRHTTQGKITWLIEKLRSGIPGLVLRTSIIVGFPGETEKDFKELLKFLSETRFERLGAFLYSKEDGTKAARFKGQVPERVKRMRLAELMKLQQGISSERFSGIGFSNSSSSKPLRSNFLSLIPGIAASLPSSEILPPTFPKPRLIDSCITGRFLGGA